MLLPTIVNEVLSYRKVIMIDTMVSMGAMALAVLAGSPVTFTGLDAKEGPHAAMMKCATTCSACAVECDGCFHHCASLVSDRKKEHATCMHCCVDCADCCRLCATLCDSSTIKHGDASVKIALTATDEVVPGDYVVKVVGHSNKGGDAKVDLKITVIPKDSFTIQLPLLAVSLKQGASTKISISISRDEKFNQDVVLSFGEIPTGVTLEPGSLVINQGGSESEITLSAASDAALGDFTVTVLGNPASGREASKELKLSVVEK